MSRHNSNRRPQAHAADLEIPRQQEVLEALLRRSADAKVTLDRGMSASTGTHTVQLPVAISYCRFSTRRA